MGRLLLFMYTDLQPCSSEHHSGNLLGQKERETDTKGAGGLEGKGKRIGRSGKGVTVGEYDPTHMYTFENIFYYA